MKQVVNTILSTRLVAIIRMNTYLVKLFPARLGGPQYVRDLLAPMPILRLVPTGGVGPENALSYLEAGAAAVAVGGNLVSPRAVEEGSWGAITAGARALCRLIHPFTS